MKQSAAISRDLRSLAGIRRGLPQDAATAKQPKGWDWGGDRGTTSIEINVRRVINISVTLIGGGVPSIKREADVLLRRCRRILFLCFSPFGRQPRTERSFTSRASRDIARTQDWLFLEIGTAIYKGEREGEFNYQSVYPDLVNPADR